MNRSILLQENYSWLVTGAAGFIGSHLVEQLLRFGQRVIGLDNFSTGSRQNLQEIIDALPAESQKFHFIEGDIRNLETCVKAAKGVDFILHQAALVGVLRSIEDPLATQESNVDGFTNMLTAAYKHQVKRFVYASSGSVYGDSPVLPTIEQHHGKILSPYAASKKNNEIHSNLFTREYGLPTVGLRYFNVYGARQSYHEPYAAVIPRWIKSLLLNKPAVIYGDGKTTRDFCYIDDVVQANLLAALTNNPVIYGQVYNVAIGEQTSLNELFMQIARLLGSPDAKPTYEEFRAGDIRYSLADISLAKKHLGYIPAHTIKDGLALAMDWYKQHL